MSTFCRIGRDGRPFSRWIVLLAATVATCTFAPVMANLVSSMSITDGIQSDGDVVFWVVLSGPSAQPVTVQYQTSDATAVAGQDYVASGGTLTLPVNTLEASISVSVSRGSTDKVFNMTLSNPVGANIQDGQAVGTVKAAQNAGCGFGVGPANLIGFYVLTWAGLVGMKVGLRRPKIIK